LLNTALPTSGNTQQQALLFHIKKHLWFIINQGADDDSSRQPLLVTTKYLTYILIAISVTPYVSTLTPITLMLGLLSNFVEARQQIEAAEYTTSTGISFRASAISLQLFTLE
jgi:hypothetical protein